MADEDLIACLYPYEDAGGKGRETIEMDENQPRHVPEQVQVTETQYNRRDRESTEPPDRNNVPPYYHGPSLALRFSCGPKTSHGFVFGCDNDCDIVLPSLPGISIRHFALTFDEKYRPIVRDLETSYGTQVVYHRQGHGFRSGFVWIVGGHPFLENQEPIIIGLNHLLKFQLVVPDHDRESQLYRDNVNRFWKGTAGAENLFGRLNMRPRLPTRPASGIQTPGTGPIFLRKKLGEGAFGVVRYFWNVSTAEEFAVKQPSARSIQDRAVDAAAWEQEAYIMGQISHEHIVRLFKAELTPLPRFQLEYVPGGSLDQYRNISVREGLQILSQCLSALAYLHGREPPIVHRDIKPSNILVQYRIDGDILVKFGDFGLSREGHDPTTICGTARYLAPEIFSERRARQTQRPKRSYTLAVDIWSLGVAVFDCVYTRPPGAQEGVSWCKRIVKKLEADHESDPDPLKQFLLDRMVIIKPEDRGSAQECYEEALRLLDDGRESCLGPAPGSFARGGMANPDDADVQTVVAQDAFPWPGNSPSEDSTDSVRRYDRSVAPPPETQMFARGQQYFDESGLQGPMSPPGGGPAAAALGHGQEQETSDWGSEESPLATQGSRNHGSQHTPQDFLTPALHAVGDDGRTRKRSTRPSKSSSSLSGKRHAKRRGQGAATALSGSTHDAADDNKDSLAPYQLPTEPNGVATWQAGLQPGHQSPGYDPYTQPDGDPADDVPVHRDPQIQRGEDSEVQMAAMLLCGMRQEL